MNKAFIAKRQTGFTLIELLVVIAVLGVLATVVIAAINPFQQLAKGRDAARLNIVGSMGQAMLSYGTTNNGNFITGSNTWIGSTSPSLVFAGEVSTIPGTITNSLTTTCAASTVVAGGSAGVQNGLCYQYLPTSVPPSFTIYTTLEATINTSKCGAALPTAYAVFSSADGRAGIVCDAAGPAAEPKPTGNAFGICATTPCTTANQFVQ